MEVGGLPMEALMNSGWIEVITGPMFAGKSEELIRRVKRLEYAKKKALVFKPLIDNRYSADEVVSHSQLKTKSINITHSTEILKYVKSDTFAVVVDEVQFLDEGILDVADVLANRGVRVILAGLDMDFRGEPFLIMAKALAKAEFITKLTAICVKCGQPATRTQRVVNGVPASYEDPIIIVGAKEVYESRCRHCHEVKKGKE